MANKLKQEQIEECKEIFDLFDADEDGYIAVEELVTVLRSLGQNISGEAEVKSLLKDVETSGGGATVDFANFLGVAACKMNERVSEKDLMEAFDVFDDSQSGVIPAEQLRQVMVNHGDRLTEEEADEMVRKADARCDERVEYKEFVKVLLNK